LEASTKREANSLPDEIVELAGGLAEVETG